ncbi:MAG: hypothetical protein V4633_16965, partial [Pseudomonadota bacterium]
DWVASLAWNGWPLCVEYAVSAIKRDSAQSRPCRGDILVKNKEITMMFIIPRCNNAGPLGKPIPTRSFAVALLARIVVSRLRW